MTYHLRSLDENNLALGGFIIPDLASPTVNDVVATADQYADQIFGQVLKYKKSGNSVVERTQADKAAQINASIDRATYQLIKSWCATQPDGCEEAFLNLGISSAGANARYQAYVTAKSGIITAQSALKV